MTEGKVPLESNWPPKIDKRSFKWRWITYTVGPLLFLIACWRGEFLNACLSFSIGTMGGLLIDFVGVRTLSAYNYPQQKFLTRDYFKLVLPAWGVFGMIINLPWNWFMGTEIQPYSCLVITAILMILYELPNFKSVSWQYHVPKQIVILGWTPMIAVLRMAFLLSLSIG